MKKYLVSLLAIVLILAMMVPSLATMVDDTWEETSSEETYEYDTYTEESYTEESVTEEEPVLDETDWHDGGCWTAEQLEAKFQEGAVSVQVGNMLIQADEYTGNVRFTDLTTGAKVDTLPVLFSEGVENVSDATARSELFSDFVGEYFYDSTSADNTVSETSAGGSTNDGWSDKQTTTNSYYSYTQCVAKNQLSIETLDNGVKLTYKFNVTDVSILPLVFSEEDFKKWVALIDDEADKEITELRYTRVDFAEVRQSIKEAKAAYDKDKNNEELESALAVAKSPLTNYIAGYTCTLEGYNAGEDGVYYIFSGVNNTGFTALTRKEQQEIWYHTGMSLDDYKEICANALGFTNPYQEGGFTYPVSYTVDEDGLITFTQYNDEITYKSGFFLVNMLTNRYICSSFVDQEGYMVVPSGSGAIINNDTSMAATTQANYSLYGNDNANTQKTGIPYRENDCIPLYGVVKDGFSITGIIKSGEGHTTIAADLDYNVGNKPINILEIEYSMTQYDNVGLTNGSNGANLEYQLFPRRIIDGKAYGLIPNGTFEITYQFDYGDDANYSHMAEIYREYLLSEGMQETVQADENLPLFVDLYGAMQAKKLILTIPFNVTQAMTTFDQAIEIMDYLKEECGVEDFAVRYFGWMNGGIYGTAPTKIRVQKQLGGTTAFKRLQSYISENGYDLYPDVNTVTVYKDEMFDGFSPNKMTSKRLDFVYAIITGTSLVTGEEDDEQHAYYVVSPKVYESIFNSFLKQAQKKIPDQKSFAFSENGKSVSSDFKLNEYIYRYESIAKVETQMKALEDAGYDLATENGNSYMLPYVSTIYRLPMNSSKLLIETEAIPLMQMAIHGSIRYSGETINEYQDDARYILKCLETGMVPSARLMYAEDEILRDTDMKDYYSLHYKNWKESISDVYAAVNEVMKDLQTERITSHKKLAEGVYEVTYGTKAKIVVNYSNFAYDYNGTSVASMGYVVK